MGVLGIKPGRASSQGRSAVGPGLDPLPLGCTLFPPRLIMGEEQRDLLCLLLDVKRSCSSCNRFQRGADLWGAECPRSIAWLLEMASSPD